MTSPGPWTCEILGKDGCWVLDAEKNWVAVAKPENGPLIAEAPTLKARLDAAVEGLDGALRHLCSECRLSCPHINDCKLDCERGLARDRIRAALKKARGE